MDKIVSFEEALRWLGKKVITVRKRDSMDKGEIGNVVAILNKKMYSPYDCSIIVQFTKCKNPNILHWLGQTKYDLFFDENFDYEKYSCESMFYIFYPNDLYVLSNK